MAKKEIQVNAKALKGPFKIIRESFTIFFVSSNLKYLVSVAVINFVLVLPLGLALFNIAYGGEANFFGADDATNINFDRISAALPLFIFTLLSLFLVGAWVNVASILAVANVVGKKKLAIVATYKEAFGKILKYFGASLIFGTLLTFGFLLFILPGILFFAWYAFATYIVLLDDTKVMASFKASKAMVKGRVVPVLYRLVVLQLFALLVNYVFSSIEILNIVLVAFSTYFAMLPYLLYLEVKK